MIPFEIHITEPDYHGPDYCRQYTNSLFLELAKELGLKTITIDLLNPKGERFRTETMTSIVKKFKDFRHCCFYVDNLVAHFNSKECRPRRVKIESPWIGDLVQQAIYVEAHFVTDSTFAYPVSRNYRKTEMLATARSHNPDDYLDFYKYWCQRSQVELCLFDSYTYEDNDWFQLWWNDHRYHPNGSVMSLVDAARQKEKEIIDRQVLLKKLNEEAEQKKQKIASARMNEIVTHLGDIKPLQIRFLKETQGFQILGECERIPLVLGTAYFDGDQEKFEYASGGRMHRTKSLFSFIKGVFACL
jgi:hypothetical protein